MDHDLDIMVGIPSANAWNDHLKLSLDAKLQERGPRGQVLPWHQLLGPSPSGSPRGWQPCFGRSSVDAQPGSMKHRLAREARLHGRHGHGDDMVLGVPLGGSVINSYFEEMQFRRAFNVQGVLFVA